MNKKVGEIMKQPVYFDGKFFHIKIADETFEAESVEELKIKIKRAEICEINIPCIYGSSSFGSEMHEIIIKRIHPDYGLIPSSDRIGVGVPNNIQNFEDVFPLTEHNKKILEEHKKMRDDGWELIREADGMCSKLESFPKNYWKDILKKNKPQVPQ